MRRIQFLGREMSNTGQTSCLSRRRRVMHGGKIFSHSQGQGGPRFVKYGPMPDRQTPTVSTTANGGFHIISLAHSSGRNAGRIFYFVPGVRLRDTEQNVEHGNRRCPSVPHGTNFKIVRWAVNRPHPLVQTSLQ